LLGNLIHNSRPDTGDTFYINEDNDCEVATGSKHWAGLYSDGEYNFYARCVVLYNRCVIRNDPTCTQTQLQSALGCSATNRLEARPFSPEYWAGIDCSGFAQMSIQNGRDVASGMNITIPPPPNWIGSQQFFTENGRVFYLANPIDGEERRMLHTKLQKGDLVRYDGHISIVYSERPNCSDIACTYRIIHASGGNCLDMNGNGSCDVGEPFNRKVGVNSTEYYRTRPIGFGRIKLWD
jgi:hypothetical protein